MIKVDNKTDERNRTSGDLRLNQSDERFGGRPDCRTLKKSDLNLNSGSIE